MSQVSVRPSVKEIIPPYGGSLINREASWGEWKEAAAKMQALTITSQETFDLLLLGIGAYSPLTGFMDEADYQAVVDGMTLANGMPWSIPITLSTTPDQAKALALGQELLLNNSDGKPVGILSLSGIFQPDKQREAAQVYQTEEPAHPGVAALMKRGEVYLSGPVRVFTEHIHFEGIEKHYPPAVSRQMFQERGWKTVVAFQTRNPVHRAHEYLQKCALEMVDGLFLHPLVGDTKSDDIPANVRMQCYDVLLKNYYNPDRSILGVYPAAMRYAGPKEALLHAIVRQNYGCTHFIVGRDHAGVGNYYGTYDAQKLLNAVDKTHLAIQPIMFENSFYCTACKQLVTVKTCPHPPEKHLSLSGTKVRELLSQGEALPEEFTRPEVAEVLKQAYA